MRIGLLADTHNNLHTVDVAAQRFREEGVVTLLHAGDVTGPQVLHALRSFDLWIAWGNMDRDPSLQPAAAALFPAGRLAYTHSLTLAGRALALLHGDDAERLQTLIRSGEYDYVIHGHTHAFCDQRIGTTRVINPGALGSTRWHAPTFAILDLATGELQLISA